MEDRFWPPEAPKPLKRFTCNLACMIVHHPTNTPKWYPPQGARGGEMRDIVP